MTSQRRVWRLRLGWDLLRPTLIPHKSTWAFTNVYGASLTIVHWYWLWWAVEFIKREPNGT